MPARCIPTRIIHAPTRAQRASEGAASSYPRLRIGLVSHALHRRSPWPVNNPGQATPGGWSEAWPRRGFPRGVAFRGRKRSNDVRSWRPGRYVARRRAGCAAGQRRPVLRLRRAGAGGRLRPLPSRADVSRLHGESDRPPSANSSNAPRRSSIISTGTKRSSPGSCDWPSTSIAA